MICGSSRARADTAGCRAGFLKGCTPFSVHTVGCKQVYESHLIEDGVGESDEVGLDDLLLLDREGALRNRDPLVGLYVKQQSNSNKVLTCVPRNETTVKQQDVGIRVKHQGEGMGSHFIEDGVGESDEVGLDNLLLLDREGALRNRDPFLLVARHLALRNTKVTTQYPSESF